MKRKRGKINNNSPDLRTKSRGESGGGGGGLGQKAQKRSRINIVYHSDCCFVGHIAVSFEKKKKKK